MAKFELGDVIYDGDHYGVVTRESHPHAFGPWCWWWGWSEDNGEAWTEFGNCGLVSDPTIIDAVKLAYVKYTMSGEVTDVREV